MADLTEDEELELLMLEAEALQAQQQTQGTRKDKARTLGDLTGSPSARERRQQRLQARADRQADRAQTGKQTSPQEAFVSQAGQAASMGLGDGMRAAYKVFGGSAPGAYAASKVARPFMPALAQGLEAEEDRIEARRGLAMTENPVSGIAGEVAGAFGPGVAGYSGLATLGRNLPVTRQIANALGNTRATSYGGRLAGAAAFGAGDAAVYGATAGAGNEQALNRAAGAPRDMSLAERASMGGEFATAGPTIGGVQVPIAPLIPVAGSIARRGARLAETGGASATPRDITERVAASQDRVSGPRAVGQLATTIDAELAGGMRPQAFDALYRVLKRSGLTPNDITALNREVGNRLETAQGAQTRLTVGQIMSDLLEERHPQASENILKVLRERRMTTRGGDRSPGIVRDTTRQLRESQIPFLQESAQRQFGEAARSDAITASQQLKREMGQEYEAVLSAGASDPGQYRELAGILQGPGLEQLRQPLKTQAAAEGLSLDEMIQRNPLEAAHWMQSTAARRARSNDANAAAFGALRNRILNRLEQDVPGYRDLRQRYGSEIEIEEAADFGTRLFGGPNSRVLTNEGERDRLVQEFQALPERAKQNALLSIRDALMARIEAGPEGGRARLSQVVTPGSLQFLERVGAKGFADDLRAISREQQSLDLIDPNANSRTFSNMDAVQNAPALYSSTPSNLVGSGGGPSSEMSLGADLVASQLAPGMTGAFTGLRAARQAIRMGLAPRNATLEDMTRLLMSRPQQRSQAAPSALNPCGGTPPPAGLAGTALAPQVEAHSGGNPYFGRRAFRTGQ